MRSLKWIIAPALLALTMSASAATKKVSLLSDATVNGTALKAGEYKVSWDDTGAVTFAKGKTVVATARGKIVDSPKPSHGTTVTLKKDSKGGYQIVKIQFNNSTSALVLDESETAQR
jgi:hypothetical protein